MTRRGRALPILVVAAGLFMAQPASAGAAAPAADCLPAPSSASVTVDTNTGPQTFSAAELCAEDSVNAQYYTRAFVGGPAQEDPAVSGGIPVSSVLALAGVDPADVTFTAVTKADGSWSTWTAAQAAEPTYGSAGLVPVLRLDGDAVDYNRPLLDDSSDVNAGDAVTTDPGSPLVITVGYGPLLTVTATADHTTVKAGATVHFSASATPAGESPSYRWSFGDGSTDAVGAAVTHSFASAGGYDVLVSAMGSGEAQGESDALVISVGTPNGQPSASPTPSPSASSPDPSQSPRPGGGHASSSPPARRASGSPSPTPSTGARPAQHGGAGRTLPELNQTPRLASRTPPAHAPIVAAAPSLVRGQLITDGTVLSARSLIVAAEPATGSATRLSSAGRAASVVGALAVILALIGAGVARELGWLGQRRRRVG